MKFTFQNLSIRKRTVLISTVLLLLLYIFCLPHPLFTVPYATVVTDKEGELLGARIAEDGQWRFPPITEVPDKFAKCLLAFEDRNFYYHWGVNPFSIGRAFVQNIQNKRIVSGGSTITMQTIRLSRGEKRTIGEKIIEIILATRLEFSYSKKNILALYASHAPFGGNVVGLEAASWRYFGHSYEQLSWAEAATLAVLPNAPSLIHLARNRTTLHKKRNRLLKYLFEKQTIDKSTYELALAEPLPGEPLPLPNIAPHLVTYFHQTAKGQHIISSIDKNTQEQVEGVLKRWNNEFMQSDIRHIAAIVVDVQTNQVVAYCGNVHTNNQAEGNQVDIIQSRRSTGSILKPFLYYAALQEGVILPQTLLPDVPVNINGFAPRNFNYRYDGAVAANEVIARSLNVPSVALLRTYSVPKFYEQLKKMGITTLNRPAGHYGLSLIVGGAEGTLWDVTSAYASMARSVIKLPNKSISCLNETHQAELPEAFEPGAAWQTLEAIKEVNRPEEIDWRTIPTMQRVAWKTGTSFGFRDAWAVGVTTRYAVGVWVGNASGEGKPNLVGARTSAPVMFDIFNLLPRGNWFPRPTEAFTEEVVCKQSGHLAGRFCDHTDTILIVPNGLRTEVCPYHQSVLLTADGTRRIYKECAEQEATITHNFFVLPPSWEWYYKQNHPEYIPLPPFKAGCGHAPEQQMQFIYPQSGAQIYLPKQQDGSPGEVTFELAHRNPDASIYWHIDDEYITVTQDIHRLTCLLSAGKHSITVVDDQGNTISVSITALNNK